MRIQWKAVWKRILYYLKVLKKVHSPAFWWRFHTSYCHFKDLLSEGHFSIKQLPNSQQTDEFVQVHFFAAGDINLWVSAPLYAQPGFTESSSALNRLRQRTEDVLFFPTVLLATAGEIITLSSGYGIYQKYEVIIATIANWVN